MIKKYDIYYHNGRETVKNNRKDGTMFPGKGSAERPGCKDVFRAFLVENAIYEGDFEIPRILPVDVKPNKLVAFSKALTSENHDTWIHFYEDDVVFERIWNNPRRYLPIIKKFEGVIAPDFSLYRDMPLVMQLWNIYRSHAIASWLQENGVPVIANVRWGDERTFAVCCNGVPKYATIAVGSHGCIKYRNEREYFTDGLKYIAQKLKPKVIIVYGTAPDEIFEQYRQKGIEILQFDSEYMIAHSRAVV